MSNQRRDRQWFRRPLRARARTWMASLLLVVLASTTAIAGAGDKLCFPTTVWFGAGIPTIDGNIDGDTGWRGAFKYKFDNGTTAADVEVQGIRTSTDIYLSVKAQNLKDWDQFSAVAFAFDPSNGTDASKQQLIVIYPVIAGATSGTHSAPTSPTEFYHGFPFTTSVPWAAGKAQIDTGYQTSGGSTFQWAMEARFAIDPTGNNGLALPASGNFGFYITVLTVPNELPTDTPGSGSVTERDWPNDAPILGCAGGSPTTCTIPASIPAENKWGSGSIDPASGCLGVSVSSQTGNIYTSSSPDNLVISLNHPNTFSAYIQNTMVDPVGTAVAAQGVKASFKIANFGLPSFGDWQIPGSEVGGSPIGGDPTNPGVSIPKSGAATLCNGPTNNNDPNCTLSTGTWALNGTEQTSYASANMGHQCILVELSADPGSNTVFTNNAAVQNMNFGMTASSFKRSADISAHGYPLPPGKTEQTFDLVVFQKAEVVNRNAAAATTVGKTGGPNAAGGPSTTGPGTTVPCTTKDCVGGKTVSQLTWVSYGCRHTNTFITVQGHNMELCNGVGAFGFVIQHTGASAVDDWNLKLSGPGLDTAHEKGGVYHVTVGNNQVGTVTLEGNPKENPVAGRFAVFADLGVAIPHGTLGNVADPGVSFNAGLEYIVKPNFSAEGIIGVHHFSGKVGTGTTAIQFTGGGKFYFMPGPNRPFVRAGLGGYHFTSGTTNFGGYFGGGWLHEFNAHFGVEGVYTFHSVNTPGTAAKFSTIQGGVRYAF